MRKISHFLLVASLIVGGLTGGIWFKLRLDTPTPEVAAARQLLTLTLPDPNGDAHAMNAWRGKILIVNFWASWCGPCREEMPGFARLQAKYAGQGAQFIGIAFDTHAAVQEFVQQTPVNYPLLIAGGPERDLMKALGNKPMGLPFTVILDREGKSIQTHLGRYEEQELDQRLAAIFAKSGPR